MASSRQRSYSHGSLILIWNHYSIHVYSWIFCLFRRSVGYLVNMPKKKPFVILFLKRYSPESKRYRHQNLRELAEDSVGRSANVFYIFRSSKLAKEHRRIQHRANSLSVQLMKHVLTQDVFTIGYASKYVAVLLFN